MKLTEIIGVLGFLLALATFIITRIERRKKLTIDLYCQYLDEVDKDNEFKVDRNGMKEDRILVIDIINQCSRSIAIDKNSIKIIINGCTIQHEIDLIGKRKFENPINPGKNYKFGVFLDNVVALSNIKDRHNGRFKIKAEVRDIEKKKYTSNNNLELLLEVDEIERKTNL